MSRSYRKNFILKNTSKFDKKYSNRIIRRKMKEITDCSNSHSLHKRMYDGYKIHEIYGRNGFKNINTWKQIQLPYYNTEKECIRDFNRWWKSK